MHDDDVVQLVTWQIVFWALGRECSITEGSASDLTIHILSVPGKLNADSNSTVDALVNLTTLFIAFVGPSSCLENTRNSFSPCNIL